MSRLPSSLSTLPLNIRALEELAVGAVTVAFYTRHPGLQIRFGEAGVRKCKEDIRHHIDHLEGALLAGDVAGFNQYSLWLSVLSSRSVPWEHISESFVHLKYFYCQHRPVEETALIDEFINAACLALVHSEHDVPAHTGVDVMPDAEVYKTLALHGAQREAQTLASGTISAELSHNEMAVRMIQAAIIDIRRIWQQNRITVVQEHLATAISQNVLARTYIDAEFARPNGKKAMFTATASNQHSLGLRILSDAFETDGWEVSYLGADVPVTDLIRQIDADKPDLLCLSLTLPSPAKA